MKEFKKSDLLTSDVVLSTKGSYGVVLKGTPKGDLIKWFLNEENEVIHKYRSFLMLNEDLTFKQEPEHRIVKVYRVTDQHYMTTMNAIDDKYLIYEEKIKEISAANAMKKLSEIFGCKVKITE